MSMLAERKVRQRWSLNPRGKDWSEDSNKFGQKMLEKMGWSKGKGLGAKEDGMTDHVKLPYKNDNKGMGYKERSDQWTEHETNFNALLKTLKENNEMKSPTGNLSSKTVSLEEKSQSLKRRVHYKKFTRGKDLSRCSEKDLAQIFGKKAFEAPVKVEEEKTVNENRQFTYNTQSIKDYFKKKLHNFGKFNGFEIGSNGVLKKSEDIEGEEVKEIRYGFGFTESPVRDLLPSSEDRKENKKKRNAEDQEEPSKKIKLENGISNPAFEPLFNKIKMKKHVLDTIQENEETEENHFPIIEKSKENSTETYYTNGLGSKIKKKKKKTVEDVALDNPIFAIDEDNEESVNNSQFEVRRKKKKKNKDEIKKTNEESFALDNPAFNIQSPIEYRPSTSEEKIHKKRKKSAEIYNGVEEIPSFEVKRKKKENSEENLAFDISENSTLQNNFEVQRKKKKKKETGEMCLENGGFSDNSVDEKNNATPNSFEVRRKKKKKKFLEISSGSVEFSKENSLEIQTKCEENLAFNSSTEESVEEPVNTNFEMKRSKKKNEERFAIDNPSFKDSPMETTEEAIIETNLILNITTTPILKPTPSKTSEKKKLQRRKSVRFSDVNEERIIPNNGAMQSVEDLQMRQELFDINTKIIEDGLREEKGFSQKIDAIEAEIENDINEAKDKVVGALLKFENANFRSSKTKFFKDAKNFPKKSYQHLIKGDVILAFNNTNLHQIEGYASKRERFN